MRRNQRLNSAQQLMQSDVNTTIAVSETSAFVPEN